MELSVTISLDSQSMSFLSVLGLSYQLQTCVDLQANDWSNVDEPVTGTGFLINLNIPSISSEESKRFYRLEVSN